MTVKEVVVPDMGGTDSVDVIELSVQVGDQVAAEDSLLVLESDKASVDVPAPVAGTLKRFLVAVGDSVKEGDPIAEIETDAEEDGSSPTQEPKSESESKAASDEGQSDQAAEEQPDKAASESQQIKVPVPDIGGAEGVEVIEINVAEGDELEPEQTMIVLETDKATMEVPAPEGGKVAKVLLKVGDKVSEGDPVLELITSGSAGKASSSASADSKQSADSKKTAAKESEKSQPASDQASSQAASQATTASTDSASSDSEGKPSRPVHAGPAVRRLARELGVDLAQVKGSGPKDRVLKEDVHAHVKQRLAQPAAAAGGSGLPPLPEIDFSKWGEVEQVELNKINKVSATNLHRAWVHIPHVTQFDEADITDLEAFRKAEGGRLEDVKLTMLAFIVKACARALLEFPKFNSSLASDGASLMMKKYVHVGIAVDTPNGLVVPVIRNADQLSVVDIAKAMTELSVKARNKKLSPGDMQGGSFSISSLGGIGGTAFTPIVNWPEVAILGVSRSQMKPVYADGEFQPRLMLPLSLSYDHRVIDGADAARFTSFLSAQLGDIRRLLL